MMQHLKLNYWAIESTIAVPKEDKWVVESRKNSRQREVPFAIAHFDGDNHQVARHRSSHAPLSKNFLYALILATPHATLFSQGHKF